ncbi:MAG: sigma-54 dependent transcriptional regulator [Planctomycetota bacterium]|nr:sigma-54 dependent transcriptional regulator [Planctomycetota bacterium]
MSSDVVLITDDDPAIRWTLSVLLQNEGFQTLEAEDGQAALRFVREGLVDLVLLDFVMPGMNGLEVLKSVRTLDPELPVILVTGHGTTNTAVEAGSHAVSGFLTKPFKNDDVVLGVRMALARCRRSQKKPGFRSPLTAGLSLREAMGPSGEIQAVVKQIEQVALSNFTVIISGETGAGKEVVAQGIHGLSRRARGPFVAVDCGAIPANLLESKLFGHEKGAFTGADHSVIGCFEAAAGGTLFFDEIGNLPLAMQVAMLRTLQERQIHRIGATAPIDLDVRILVATNENLETLVQAGRFRRDLFYRLNEFNVTIPPLRERPEDIIFLTKRFLDWTREELEKEACVMTHEAVEMLLDYPWPGNIRELRNVIRRAVLLAESSIAAEHLQLAGITEPAELSTADSPETPNADPSFKNIMQGITSEAERTILAQYLRKTQGNLKAAAQLLHMDYKTIRTKAKQYQLLPRERVLGV